MSGASANFLHLGPSRTGTTWLHEVLRSHPEIYLSSAKELYFFSRYYDRGPDWYHAQFRDAPAGQKIVGEFSPDYLACPEAPERIRACLGPDVRLMVTLREPASRAFSSYLYLQRHGLAAGSFQQTALTALDLLDQSRYATHLRRYLRYFDRASLYIAVFDDLEADPQAFLDGITDWLGVAHHVIGPDQLEAQLPASKARWLSLAMLVKHSSNWVRRHDGAELIARVKRSPLVQWAMYKPYGTARPTMSQEDTLFVREHLAAEIAGVEEEFGIQLRLRWGWQ
jgi:Sulfotransferase family